MENDQLSLAEDLHDVVEDDVLEDDPEIGEWMFPTDEQLRNEELVYSIREAETGSSHENEAWKAMYETHWQAVFYAALRVTRDVGDAEDVAQHAFQRAFDNLDQLQEPKALRKWLCVTAHRLALNYLQRDRKETVQLEHDNIDSNGMGTRGKAPRTTDPSDILMDSEKWGILESCIERLPPSDGELIRRFYFGHLSLKDLSVLHDDAPIGTIKRRLHTARWRLRTILSAHFSAYKADL